MKRSLFCSYLLMIALGTAATEVPAVESATVNTNEVSLEALVAEALERNPELKFYEAEIAAAKAERKTVGLLANPELSSSLGQKRVSSGALSSEGAAWSVSLMQPFEWPGRIGLRKAIANHQIKLAELGYSQFKTTLAARMRTLGYRLMAAQEKAAAAREVADRFHALREVLLQRDPAGLTPALELRIIESTALTLQRRATAEALEQQSALLELNQLSGRSWDSPLRVKPVDLGFTAPPEWSVLLQSALTNNFELRVREAELEQQGFKVALARNERFPSVTVGPFFSQERAGDDERIVGLGVSIPLPLWNRNKGNIEAAKARAIQAQTSFYVAQRDLERKVAEQRLRYQTKLDEMAHWRPDSVEQFRESASLADRHYRLGAVPVTTYIELQKQYLEAIEALLDTKREALEAGQELQLLTGFDFNALKITTKEQGKP